MDKQFIKQHIISAVLTFVTAAAIVILPQIDSLTMESFKDGAFWGVIFAAVRAGVKALVQTFLIWRGSDAKI